MPAKPKVVFFLPSLGGGGAEMHLLRILNHASWESLDPHLILARPGGVYEARLNSRVGLSHLLPRAVKSSTLSMLLSVLPLKVALRRLRPALVGSLLNHATAVAHAALPAGKNRPVFLAGLQNNISRDLDLGSSLPAQWLRTRIIEALGQADHLVALSRGVSANFSRSGIRRKGPLTTIYNAGYDDSVASLAREPLTGIERPARGKLLVACGRLTRQKNFELLLNALAIVRKNIHVTLWLLGRGELRGELERTVSRLGLSDSVRFLGFQSNPFKYMAAADAFVLSSDWEGFGNVVVEAMSLGVPVISTACPFGPPEIIQSRKNGLLVPVGACDALAGAISSVLQNDDFATKLGEAGRHRAKSFHARAIAAEYERLLESLVFGSRSIGSRDMASTQRTRTGARFPS